MNIVLCGMPSCGKTTVANILADKFKFKLIDTDAEIVERYGAIADIFENYGEEAFRNLESEVVKDISNCDGTVVSTGGGCVLRAENVAELKRNGKIVFLNVALNELLSRITGDTSRPLLNGDSKAKMRKMFAERTPIYESVADITLETDGLSPDEIAQKIAETVK